MRAAATVLILSVILIAAACDGSTPQPGQRTQGPETTAVRTATSPGATATLAGPTATPGAARAVTPTPLNGAGAGTIVGVVRDNSARPLANVDVQLQDAPTFATRSGIDGRYLLAGVPTGDHVVVVWTAALISASKDVTVDRGAQVSADFVLVTAVPTPAATAQGTIVGVVTDSVNRPVANASVRLKELPQLTTRTGTDGRYRLASVPSGDYRLIGWVSEFQARERDISVAPGGTVTADLVLVTALPVLVPTIPPQTTVRPVPPVILTQIAVPDKLSPATRATVTRPSSKPALGEPSPTGR